MQTTRPTLARALLVSMFLIGWFAVIGQLVIYLQSKAASVPELFVRFFSFFTIENNILVAVMAGFLLLSPNSGPGRFFNRQPTQAAVTMYIVIVGLIYNTILRGLRPLSGMERLFDELLHSVIPLLALVYWLACAKKDQLQYKHIGYWLIFPLLYIVYTLIRGQYYDFYPYPFVNVHANGLNTVLINSLGIAAVFAIISAVFVGIGKMSAKPAAKP